MEKLRQIDIEIVGRIAVVLLLVAFVAILGPILCVSGLIIQFMIHYMTLKYVYQTFFLFFLPAFPLFIGFVLMRFEVLRHWVQRHQRARWTFIAVAGLLNYLLGVGVLLWGLTISQYAVAVYFYPYTPEVQADGVDAADLEPFAVPAVNEMWIRQVIPAEMRPACSSHQELAINNKKICQLADRAPEAARNVVGGPKALFQLIVLPLIPTLITILILWLTTLAPKLFGKRVIPSEPPD